MWPCLILAFITSLSLSTVSVNYFSNIYYSPPILSIILIISLFIPYSSIFLLSIDLISSNTENFDNFFYIDNKNFILFLWKINYWIGFFFTWSILPIIQTFFNSNNYLFKKKINDSIIYNLKFYSIWLLIGLVGLIYIYFNIGLNFNSIKALIIILSHSYSLILSIWFMGYGLINLPKIIFWNNLLIRLNDNYLINHYYLRLLMIKNDYFESKNNLIEIIQLIKNLKLIKDLQNVENHKNWINYLNDLIDNSLKFNSNKFVINNKNLSLNLINYNNRFNNDINLLNNQLSDDYLLIITKNFKDSYYQFIINETIYYNLLTKIIKIQDIKNSRLTKSLIFRNQKNNSVVNKVINERIFKSSRSKFWYYFYLNPIMKKILAIVLAVLSLLIILSEIFHNTKFSVLNYLIIKNEKIWFINLIILIILSYMSITALHSLSKFKIFLVYKLIFKNSNPASCVWYSSYAIRLTIPLCYNFLTLLNNQILSNNFTKNNNNNFEKSQFALFLGNSINLLPLGQSINNLLPYFILIPIFIQFYNIKSSHSKIKRNNNNNEEENSGNLHTLKRKVSGIISDFEFLLFDDDDDDEEEEDDDIENNRYTNYSDSSTSNLLDQPTHNIKLQNIIERVNKLIELELNNNKSLLNNYNDNYSIFWNISLGNYLKEVFGKNQAIQLNDDQEEIQEFEFNGEEDEDEEIDENDPRFNQWR